MMRSILIIRLVAGELERRWNEKLEALQELESAHEEAQTQDRFRVTDQEQKDIERLTHDLPAIWYASSTTDRERKQLLRYLIAEVQLDGLTPPGKIGMRLTWRSGAVTSRQIDRLKVGSWAPKTAGQVIDRIRALAPTHTVAEIIAT
jgi:hypothetical protein